MGSKRGRCFHGGGQEQGCGEAGLSSPWEEVVREGSLGEVRQSLDGIPRKEVPFCRGWGLCKQLCRGDTELASCFAGLVWGGGLGLLCTVS